MKAEFSNPHIGAFWPGLVTRPSLSRLLQPGRWVHLIGQPGCHSTCPRLPRGTVGGISGGPESENAV